jgi:hypothetical protein
MGRALRTAMEIIKRHNAPTKLWFMVLGRDAELIGRFLLNRMGTSSDEMFDRLIQRQVNENQTRMVMLIMDGLGGLARDPGGKTELESAYTPNLDALAAVSSLGLTVPIGPGITPGSGPGHLAIFGYDPLQYEIGRGAMEALGVDFDLRPDDLAARGNFCTVDSEGRITDRRAGRLSTELSRELAELLQSIRIEDVEIFIEPVKEHRFAFVLRCLGLNDALSDSDPQTTGISPLPIRALNPDAEKSARIVNQFIRNARGLLTGNSQATWCYCGVLPGCLLCHLLKKSTPKCSCHCIKWDVPQGCPNGRWMYYPYGNTIQDEFDALEKIGGIMISFTSTSKPIPSASWVILTGR